MKTYKIWLDDERKCPIGYIHFHSVNETTKFISSHIDKNCKFILNLDHDLGEFAKDGGDGIELIKYLLNNEYGLRDNISFEFILHTMNPVGRENMQSLVDRYF
jgi:hypothetical protein